jgi:hypothetical protein
MVEFKHWCFEWSGYLKFHWVNFWRLHHHSSRTVIHRLELEFFGERWTYYSQYAATKQIIERIMSGMGEKDEREECKEAKKLLELLSTHSVLRAPAITKLVGSFKPFIKFILNE